MFDIIEIVVGVAFVVLAVVTIVQAIRKKKK